MAFPRAGMFAESPNQPGKPPPARKPHPGPDAVLEVDLADPNPAPVTPARAGIAGGAEVVIALISPPHISAAWKAAPSGLGHL